MSQSVLSRGVSNRRRELVHGKQPRLARWIDLILQGKMRTTKVRRTAKIKKATYSAMIEFVQVGKTWVCKLFRCMKGEKPLVLGEMPIKVRTGHERGCAVSGLMSWLGGQGVVGAA